MDAFDLVREALADPFRWGLLTALVATMLRTEAATGRWVPLLAGAAFVAAIIPMTTATPEGVNVAEALVAGLIANALALAVLLALLEVWVRLRR